jgi:transposase
MDRLLVAVQAQLRRDGFDGAAYLFRNKSGTRIKIVCADAQGMWLAHVLVSKYADHIPLNRLIGMLLRSGVELPISTLSERVGA